MTQQLLDLINSQEHNLFVFDFDGTLVEAKYGKNSILQCRDDDTELLKLSLSTNVYEHSKSLQLTKDLVYVLKDKNYDVKILTRIHNGIEMLQKSNFVKGNYKCLNANTDVIGVFHEDDKLTVLKFYEEQYDNIIYIDDTLATLIKMEESGLVSNLHCFHVSSVYVEDKESQ